jgi:hypothetical protein
MFEQAKKCCYCQCILTNNPRGKVYTAANPMPPNAKTIDHKFPIIKGGTNHLSNLCVACYQCNTEKGKLTEQEYRAVLAFRKGLLTPPFSFRTMFSKWIAILIPAAASVLVWMRKEGQ